MYIRVLCTIIYQSDDLALSASDMFAPSAVLSATALLLDAYIKLEVQLYGYRRRRKITF